MTCHTRVLSFNPNDTALRKTEKPVRLNPRKLL
jgi:hypothetical protein